MFRNQKTLSNRYTRCLFLLEPTPSFSGEISFVFLNRLFTLLDFLVGAIDPLCMLKQKEIVTNSNISFVKIQLVSY